MGTSFVTATGGVLLLCTDSRFISSDIDECADNIDDCQQLCVNVGGTYNCACNYGYRLNIDRATCSQSEYKMCFIENCLNMLNWSGRTFRPKTVF